MLAEDAIKAAVKDYEAKKAKKGQKGEDSSVEKAAEAWLKFLLSQIIQTHHYVTPKRGAPCHGGKKQSVMLTNSGFAACIIRMETNTFK
jgi:hypothetical protein